MSTKVLPKIQVRNLKKSFGTKHVLTGVSFDVHQGQSLVIIGGSGTGKSVTLKCILGLIEPDEGSILVDGVEQVKASESTREETREKISMLFQGSALFDSLSVWENISFRLLRESSMTRQKAKEIAIDKLKAVRLGEHVADLFPSELSGGMQRRVALARTIVSKPDIIFFDEPTAGLDPINGDRINGLIRQCVQDLGSTSITITHDIPSARKIADYVAMIHGGKIIWLGPVEQLEESGNDYVDQFIHGRSKGPIVEDVNM